MKLLGLTFLQAVLKIANTQTRRTIEKDTQEVFDNICFYYTPWLIVKQELLLLS